MEKFVKIEPHGQVPDSEKKKTEIKTINSSLTKTQKREPGGSSTRMENFVKIEPHGQVPDSEEKRTEMKKNNSSLTGVSKPDPNLPERKINKPSARMEELREARPTTATNKGKAKRHPAIENQDDTDLESDEPVWETLTEIGKPENQSEYGVIQSVGNHPSGNISAGQDGYEIETLISDRKSNVMESEPHEYNMDPPGLTDSESEEESEEETEDETQRNYHPSYLPISRSIFTSTETSDASTDAPDEDAQELRIYREKNKSKLHKNKLKHSYHPSGRALLRAEDQQRAIPDKESRDLAPRKERISNTYLRSDGNEQIEDIFNSDRKPEQAKILSCKGDEVYETLDENNEQQMKHPQIMKQDHLTCL